MWICHSSLFTGQMPCKHRPVWFGYTYCVHQDESEQKEQELLALRQKLSTLELDSQKRVSELENQLTEALSSAATAAAAAAAGGE